MKRENLKLLLALAAALLLTGLAAANRNTVYESIQTFQDWTARAGPLGAVAYCVAYVIATVAFLPGWIFTIGAGVIYGVLIGSVIVSIGSTLGASLAFLLARYFFRDAVAKKVEGNESFRAIDAAIGVSGWKIVFLIRLSPVFPFNLLNYALGLTTIPFLQYFLASWIGMLPGTIMYVYLGAIGHAITGKASKTPGQRLLFAVGLIATLLVVVFVGRIAARSLKKERSTSRLNAH